MSSNAEVVEAETGGRPPIEIWGRHGMVSSMHPAATDAGVAVLKAGGNAIDAAIAAGAVVSVTNHNWSGIAGDTAWLIYTAQDGQVHHLDGYSVCPRCMTVEELARRTGVAGVASAGAEEPPNMRDRGVATSMVPGTPFAWNAVLNRFGTMQMAALFERAIELARDGVPLSSYVHQSLTSMRGKLGAFASSRPIYFDRDGPRVVGDTIVQRDLADTYERYARNPASEFATGETAQRIAAHCKENGGFITLDDLQTYQVKWREPVCGSYRGNRICVTAPPTAGIHLLQALAIAERHDFSKFPYHSPEALHFLIEAVKLSLADRRAWGGDPDSSAIPVRRLLDTEYLARQGARIAPKKSQPFSSGITSVAGSTTHIVVMDAAGNIVSTTQSIGGDFGCGDTVPGTGLLMNDRTWWMSLADGPNQVAPGRRVNIGHAPAIVFNGDKPWMSVGSPGGFGIISHVTQTLVNVIDYGMPLQLAIECPRFRVNNLEHKVGCENRIDRQTLETLKSYGHDVEIFPAWSDKFGGMQGVLRDRRTGALQGGYDPRRNSTAGGI